MASKSKRKCVFSEIFRYLCLRLLKDKSVSSGKNDKTK
jgi:hypothetical protein